MSRVNLYLAVATFYFSLAVGFSLIGQVFLEILAMAIMILFLFCAWQAHDAKGDQKR